MNTFQDIDSFLQLQIKRGVRTLPVKDISKRFPGIPKREISRTLRTSSYGSYIVGRRGRPTRFEFKITYDGETVNAPFGKASHAEAFIRYPFPLSNGWVTTVSLPVDIEAREIDRLCRYLQTLKLEGNDA